MVILGLTGSIGMGKSTTASMFRDAGIPVFDADAAVHALYAGAAVPAIERAFPGTTKDGVVDRELLRQRVFDDSAVLRRLEAIVHPMVQEVRAAFLAEAEDASSRLVVLDIPLLYETGAECEVDAVAVVSAPEAVQKARVMARAGMTEERFSAIMARQVPDSVKRRRADFVIETGGGLERARARVSEIIEALSMNPAAES